MTFVFSHENVMTLVFSHENVMTLVFSHEYAKIDWIWVLFRGRRLTGVIFGVRAMHGLGAILCCAKDIGHRAAQGTANREAINSLV